MAVDDSAIPGSSSNHPMSPPAKAGGLQPRVIMNLPDTSHSHGRLPSRFCLPCGKRLSRCKQDADDVVASMLATWQTWGSLRAYLCAGGNRGWHVGHADPRFLGREVFR